MTADPPRGRIVSFYSFKGGVGRTMALANVAFLAAANGLDVLVMDWDLEAPGLHHYFRGIVDGGDMAALREAEGVLDVAWEWRHRIEAAQSREDVDAIFQDFHVGTPFTRRLEPIWTDDEFGADGRIDIIPAGAPRVATPELIEYERALASFSWSDFLDRYAGGGMISALRNWASRHYDLVLIDSRTGLADVAGICTMQLPDAVVLAFVLNRQNIEGAARVAGAIRSVRENDVRIWPVPMRVSREGTAEEADAMARALREFGRVAGLEADQAERDMRGLMIKAEPNVPFMESLAPFNDTDAALDPLTANMARLTKEITGIEIDIPEISPAWRDQVHSRLAPALSTEAYLRQLMTAEPLRAARELHRFVESALTTVSDGEHLDDDYVLALVETSFALYQRADSDLDVGYDTPSRVLMLLRRLYDADHDRWRKPLADALQTSLDQRFDFFSAEDELATLEEIDELLAGEAQTAAVLLQRAEIRLRVARSFIGADEAPQKLTAAEDALLQLNKARKELGEESEHLALLRLEAMYQRGDALETLNQPGAAELAFKKIVKAAESLAGQSGRPEHTRLAFDANFRLMRLARTSDPLLAADYARAAILHGNPAGASFLSRIAELADAVIEAPDPEAGAHMLLKRLLTSPAAPRAMANFVSRSPRSAHDFIEVLSKLIASTSHEHLNEYPGIVGLAIETVAEVLGNAQRRLGSVPRQGGLRVGRALAQPGPMLIEAGTHFLTVLEHLDVPGLGESLSRLVTAIHQLEESQLSAGSSRPGKPSATP